MKYPKVSIIMPVYNAAVFLHRSVTSLMQQTYVNTEIIIVDDSSTDNSYMIAKQFESENIKVFQQVNAGAAVARNTGLAHATGDYIQFMDADDYLSMDKIEKQVNALELNPRKVAVCNYQQFSGEDDLKTPKNIAYQDQFIYSSNDPCDFLINLWGGGKGIDGFIQTSCWLVPAYLVAEVKGWRNYRSVDDDGEFFARILLSSCGIVYTKDCMVYYRKSIQTSNSSLSGSKKYPLLRNMLLTIDLKYSYLTKHTKDERVKFAFARQYLNFAVYNYPTQKVLSAIAYNRYKSLGVPVKLPLLGGKFPTTTAKFFGWKISRLVRYYLKERNING